MPKRLTLTISKQYPVTSLNGMRLEALRAFYPDDLEEQILNAAWAVLGPLGSVLADLPDQQVRQHLISGKHTVERLHQDAQDMRMADQQPPSDSPPEPSPVVADQSLDSGGDPMANLF